MLRLMVRARPGMAARAVMLRPGMMGRRRGMMMGRRGRRRRVTGSGFGFRGGEDGGSGDCAEDGGKAEQERTAAEARAFGTLHDDLLFAAEFYSYRISNGFDFIILNFLMITTPSCFRILSYACAWAARLKPLLQDGAGERGELAVM